MNHLIYTANSQPVKVGDAVEVAPNISAQLTRLPTAPIATFGGPAIGYVGYKNENGDYREIKIEDIGVAWAHPHRTSLHDGKTIEYMGLTFTVDFSRDIDCEAPWERGDGYGVISDYTNRDKLPSERLLYDDRGSKRYYDWAASIKKAKAEGWDAAPYGTGTKGEQAVRAVQADFEFHKAWCDNQWEFVIVTITCVETGAEENCGGFETYKDYHMEAAWEMIEAMAEQELKRIGEEAAAEQLAKEADIARRTVMTTYAIQLWQYIREGMAARGSDPDLEPELRAAFMDMCAKTGIATERCVGYPFLTFQPVEQ